LLDDLNATIEDFDILKYVADRTGNSLGMSMSANFDLEDESSLNAMLAGIKSIMETDSVEWAQREK
jgi:hypothetical protein